MRADGKSSGGQSLAIPARVGDDTPWDGGNPRGGRGRCPRPTRMPRLHSREGPGVLDVTAAKKGQPWPDDRRPARCQPGWATCPSSSGSWPTASRPSCCPGATPPWSSATCIIRSARSTSPRARPGWRTSSSTCSSRGPSGSPRARSTGSRSWRPGSRTPRRARTAPTTGSPSPPTAGSWRCRRGRPDARRVVRPARGRGRAARHRRGAGPGPRLAPGAARPDAHGRLATSATRTATRSWAGRRTGGGSAGRPARLLSRALPPRRRRAGPGGGRRAGGGARPGRGPLRPPGRPATAARRSGPRRAPPERSAGTFPLSRAGGHVRGILGWHTVPRGHPDGPALDVPPTC